MKISNVFSFIIPLIFCITAQAAPSGMKPGLWEHSFTIKSESGKIEKAMADLKIKMAKMSADQRKMMEEVMAKQGLAVNQQLNSMKICISKEQAENLEIPQGQHQNCTQEVISRTKNSVKMKFNCTGLAETEGVGEFTLTSPTAYTGKSVINSTVNHKTERMDMKQKGKWLSSNCGEIKPIPIKK